MLTHKRIRRRSYDVRSLRALEPWRKLPPAPAPLPTLTILQTWPLTPLVGSNAGLVSLTVRGANLVLVSSNNPVNAEITTAGVLLNTFTQGSFTHQGADYDPLAGAGAGKLVVGTPDGVVGRTNFDDENYTDGFATTAQNIYGLRVEASQVVAICNDGGVDYARTWALDPPWTAGIDPAPPLNEIALPGIADPLGNYTNFTTVDAFRVVVQSKPCSTIAFFSLDFSQKLGAIDLEVEGHYFGGIVYFAGFLWVSDADDTLYQIGIG